MRTFFLSLCAALVCADPPHTVSQYDIQSYAGKWYQIADYPQFYEKFYCKDCVTAEYTLNDDKTIKVVNTCRNSPSGSNTSVTAKAMIKDPSQPGKLTVLFAGLFPAQYWIVALGPKNTNNLYEWALVSNSERSSCYILSRTPSISDGVKSMVFLAMAKNQLDNSTKKLPFTQQAGCWSGEEEEEAEEAVALKEPTVGHPDLHASCKMTMNFASADCNTVLNALSVASKSMSGVPPSGCGKVNPPADNFCGYQEIGRTASLWKGKHTTANGKYVDDLTFTMSAAGSGCSAAAHSTSETWYAILDNGVNYCNLHNLAAATNISFTETDVSSSTCTQYSSSGMNCQRY